MSGEVVALNPKVREQLQSAGVETSDVPLSEEEVRELKLPEPKYGEVVLGELAPDQARLFKAVHETNARLEDLNRRVFGEYCRRLGEQVESSDRAKPLQELMQEGKLGEVFGDGEEHPLLDELSKVGLKKAYLHGLLIWHLASHFECCSYIVGVRAPKKGSRAPRAVRGERRY